MERKPYRPGPKSRVDRTAVCIAEEQSRTCYLRELQVELKASTGVRKKAPPLEIVGDWTSGEKSLSTPSNETRRRIVSVRSVPGKIAVRSRGTTRLP